MREEVANVVRSTRLDPPHLALLATLVLATALRLVQLGHESLWADETSTWDYVARKYTPYEILTELPYADPHPPLYYLLVDGWTAVFGTSEVALRFPSVVFGVLAVGLIYLVGATLFDRWTGVVAAALLAISSFHLYYAQEARMYALLLCLSLGSMYAFVCLLRQDAHDQLTVNGYVLLTVLLGYTHVYGLVVILAQNVYVGVQLAMASDRLPIDTPSLSIDPGVWMGLQAFVGALLIPWIVVLSSRIPGVSSGTGDRIARLAEPSVALLVRTVKTYFAYFGQTPPTYPLVGIGLALVLALGGLRIMRRTASARALESSPVLLAAVWFVVPIAVPYAVSAMVTPILEPRFTISASAGLFLLVANGVRTAGALAPRPVEVLLAGLLLATLAVPLPAYYGADQKEQWDEATAHVETRAVDGALVAISDDYMHQSYAYYASRSQLDVVGIDDTAPTERWLAAIEGRPEVWLVLSHTDRDDALTDRIEANGFDIAATTHYVDVEVIRLVPESDTEG